MFNYSLQLVADRSLCGTQSLESVVDLAVQGGVNLVQLREKNADFMEFLLSSTRNLSWIEHAIINPRDEIRILPFVSGIIDKRKKHMAYVGCKNVNFRFI